MVDSDPLRVLVVFAAKDHRIAEIFAAFQKDGHQLISERVDSAEGMSAALARSSWDLVIADPALVQFTGADLVELMTLGGFDIPVLMLTDAPLEFTQNQKSIEQIIAISPTNTGAIVAFVRERIKVSTRKNHPESTGAMLRYLAEYDPLTNLPNRHLFNENLQKSIKRSPAEPFAIIILGLDRFRDINHVLGPNCGDQLLKQAAQRFERATSAATSWARLGGDEFAAIVPCTETKKSAVFAKIF